MSFLPDGKPRSDKHWYTIFSVLPDANVRATTLTGTRPLASTKKPNRIQLSGERKLNGVKLISILWHKSNYFLRSTQHTYNTHTIVHLSSSFTSNWFWNNLCSYTTLIFYLAGNGFFVGFCRINEMASMRNGVAESVCACGKMWKVVDAISTLKSV